MIGFGHFEYGIFVFRAQRCDICFMVSHRNLYFFGFLIFSAFLFSCKGEGSGGSEDSVSSLVNIPVDADEIIDTTNAARLVFEKTLIDWDTIRQGDKFDATFHFTNEGNRLSLISQLRNYMSCYSLTLI